jgi:hypothetical protein
MLAQVDLEELVQRCRSANARAYIKEAVDCYRIGAYRACVITTWIALVYDFIDKLRELALAGDAAATTRVAEFDAIQKRRDTEAALKFERDVLAIAKDEFELITVQEMNDLGRVLDDRNRCGHPNLNRDNEVYTPPPELARLHLRTVIEHVLERPPVQGKAALALLHQTVDSDYFPTNTADAEPLLRATPLPRAKPNVISEFTLGGLVSLIREVLPEKKMLQRLAAAQVAQRMHPAVVGTLLNEKFDNAVLKTGDAFMSRVLWLLVSAPDLQPVLKEATWIRLQSYVRTMPAGELAAVLLALRIPTLRELAVARLQSASDLELTFIVSGLKAPPDSTLVDHVVATYAASGSWDSANSRAKNLIDPLIRYMNAEQARAVIAAGRNGEVRESFQFSTVAWGIKASNTLTEQQLADAVRESGLAEKLGHLIAPPDQE